MRATTLDQSTGPFHVGDEVLEQVEQSPSDRTCREIAVSSAIAPRVAVGVDDLPVAEELPRRVRRADLGLAAVGEQHEAVRDEQLRDRVAVVGEVRRRRPTLTGSFGSLNSISTSGTPLTNSATSRRRLCRLPLTHICCTASRSLFAESLQVEVAQRLDALVAVVVGPLGPVTVAEQVVDLAVGADPVHHRTVLGERLDRLVDRGVWYVHRVEFAHREAQPMGKHHVVLGVTTERALGAESLLEGIDASPTELRRAAPCWAPRRSEPLAPSAPSRHRLLKHRVEVERRDVDLPGHQLRQQKVRATSPTTMTRIAASSSAHAAA